MPRTQIMFQLLFLSTCIRNIVIIAFFLNMALLVAICVHTNNLSHPLLLESNKLLTYFRARKKPLIPYLLVSGNGILGKLTKYFVERAQQSLSLDMPVAVDKPSVFPTREIVRTSEILPNPWIRYLSISCETFLPRNKVRTWLSSLLWRFSICCIHPTGRPLSTTWPFPRTVISQKSVTRNWPFLRLSPESNHFPTNRVLYSGISHLPESVHFLEIPNSQYLGKTLKSTWILHVKVEFPFNRILFPEPHLYKITDRRCFQEPVAS